MASAMLNGASERGLRKKMQETAEKKPCGGGGPATGTKRKSSGGGGRGRGGGGGGGGGEQNNNAVVKRPKVDCKSDMLSAYQPWVIQTYGDLAKTKTITIKKYARILRTLRGDEVVSADNSKFRFWVKAKGFHVGKPPGYDAKPADAIVGRYSVCDADVGIQSLGDKLTGSAKDPPLYVPNAPFKVSALFVLYVTAIIHLSPFRRAPKFTQTIKKQTTNVNNVKSKRLCKNFKSHQRTKCIRNPLNPYVPGSKRRIAVFPKIDTD